MNYKRLFDLSISIIGLMVLIIPLTCVCFIISLLLKSNPIFTQLRMGRNHQEIKVYKLKTLNERRDECGILLSDELRATKFGTILRNYSIDEFPQLINVILGNMSLVGPRPLLLEYRGKYTSFQDQRHQVKPGITGLSQIRGRNSVTWRQKFAHDVWYVKNRTFRLDIWIIWQTMHHVIAKKGVSPKNRFTSERFDKKKDT